MVNESALVGNDPDHLLSIAEGVARELTRARILGSDVFIQTPIAFPSGRGVSVKLLGGPDFFTITDDGSAMREAELMGADDICRREAKNVADEYGLKFNQWELFEVEAPRDRLVGLSAVVANAAAVTMIRTSYKFAERFALRRQEELSVRLMRVFGKQRVAKDIHYPGAARSWPFDAHVSLPSGRVGLFSMVTPAPVSIAFAYSKFDDVSRVEKPPFIGAVLDGVFDPADKALISRAARRLFSVSDPDDAFLMAA